MLAGDMLAALRDVALGLGEALPEPRLHCGLSGRRDPHPPLSWYVALLPRALAAYRVAVRVDAMPEKPKRGSGHFKEQTDGRLGIA